MTAYRYGGYAYHYRPPLRYRWRRFSRSRNGKAVIISAAAVGLLAGTSAGHSLRHHHAALVTLSIPVGGSYTPQTWAAAFLGAIGMPATACNLGAITAWEAAEGGNWANSATANPLDTTQPEPGSYGINSVNVQAYTSWQQGLTATVQTITNGLYLGILSALHAGNDAQAVADAVAASPWGTGSFGASC